MSKVVWVNIFSSPTGLRRRGIHIFDIYVSISKDSFVPQIFALLHQRPKFDLFQETLFCTLVPSSNLVPKVVPVEIGQHLCIVFTYFY